MENQNQTPSIEEQLALANAKLAALEETAVANEKALAEANAKISSLSIPTSADPAVVEKKELPLVKVGKETYRFTAAKFSVEGETYTAEQASANKELLTKLVEMGAGVIEKV